MSNTKNLPIAAGQPLVNQVYYIPDAKWSAKMIAPSSVLPARRKTQTMWRIGEALQRSWRDRGQVSTSRTTLHRV